MVNLVHILERSTPKPGVCCPFGQALVCMATGKPETLHENVDEVTREPPVKSVAYALPRR